MFPCKPKSLNFSLLLDITPTKKLSPAVPLLISDHILEKKVSIIAFRKILSKILLAAYIFSNAIMTNLKKLIGNKPLIQNSVQKDYFPELPSKPLWQTLGMRENTSQWPKIHSTFQS